MQLATKGNSPEEWVKVLAKGMVTIPKVFRDELGIKEGEVAKVRKVGKRLIIEPREVADYEIFTDKELVEMLEEDKLPKKLSEEAAELWSDIE